MTLLTTKTRGYDARLNGDPEPTAVHVGIDKEDVPNLPMYMAFAVDADGWEEWGEPLNQHPNDGRTAHVVFLTHNPVGMVDALRYTVRLVPNRDGVMAVTSDPFVWSENQHIVARANPVPLRLAVPTHEDGDMGCEWGHTSRPCPHDDLREQED